MTRQDRINELRRLYSQGYSMPISDLAIANLQSYIRKMDKRNNMPSLPRASTIRPDNSHWENLVDNSQ